MSLVYSYYIGYEEPESGIIKPLGPFTCEGRIKPVLERSCSFASDLHNNFYTIKEDAVISRELRELFEYEDWKGEKRVDVKYLPFDELPDDDFIKNGYFLIDDVQAWEQGGDDSLFYNMISPTVYAAMVKNELVFGKNQPEKDDEGNEYTKPNASEYMHYAAPQYDSKEYESFIIKQVVGMLCDYDFCENKRIVILETEG